MRKFIVASSIALLTFAPVPAMAQDNSSVVIIDSGFDTSKLGPNIKELCITSLNVGCNNGKGFDDSVGSAGSKVVIGSTSSADWNHGTIMADIVKQVNPNAKLILIRNARVSSLGTVTAGSANDFNASLKWVIANKGQYNISAVSFSRGSHTSGNASNSYCPVDQQVRSSIVSLQTIGVPTIIAAGNDRDKTRIDYPACISEAVAISGISSWSPAVFSSYFITNGTNASAQTDFYAYGDFNTVLGRVAQSTSSSTAAFAGYWSKVSNGNYFETYSKISLETSGQKFVNVLK